MHVRVIGNGTKSQISKPCGFSRSRRRAAPCDASRAFERAPFRDPLEICMTRRYRMTRRLEFCVRLRLNWYRARLAAPLRGRSPDAAKKMDMK